MDKLFSTLEAFDERIPLSTIGGESTGFRQRSSWKLTRPQHQRRGQRDAKYLATVSSRKRHHRALLPSHRGSSALTATFASWVLASSQGEQVAPCHAPSAAKLFSPQQRWGEFLVSRVSSIEWRNESFAHLVIPNSYRRIIKALVTVHAGDLKQQLMTDVVEGKGTGLVMALHGSPGTGKVRAPT